MIAGDIITPPVVKEVSLIEVLKRKFVPKAQVRPRALSARVGPPTIQLTPRCDRNEEINEAIANYYS